MQPCSQFEERILDYDELPAVGRAEVDAHLATCAGCFEFSYALSDVDHDLQRSLMAEFGVGVAATGIPIRTETPPERPALLPELLDFAGWSSVMAAVLATAVVIAPPVEGSSLWVWLGGAVIAGSSWIGIRTWRELR